MIKCFQKHLELFSFLYDFSVYCDDIYPDIATNSRVKAANLKTFELYFGYISCTSNLSEMSG